MNRAQRRALRTNAKAVATVLASRCYDFHGATIAPVSDPRATAALARAFANLLRFCKGPVAVRISDDEARGFPRNALGSLPDGVTWLAVGFDTEGRASYALQTVQSPIRAVAHETARAKALANLAKVCATPGFPTR